MARVEVGGWRTGDVVRNIYRGPAEDHLQRRVTEGYVFGEVRISDFEMKTYYTGDERAFVALMQARLVAALDEMAEALCIQTLPVHDEPGVVCNTSWHYAT